MEHVFKIGLRTPDDKSTQIYEVVASDYEEAMVQVKEAIPTAKPVLCLTSPIGVHQ